VSTPLALSPLSAAKIIVCFKVTLKRTFYFVIVYDVVFLQHYCVERPFKPPPKSFKPMFDSLYLCGPMADLSTYKSSFQAPRKVHSLIFGFYARLLVLP